VVADLEQGIYNPEAVIEIIDAIILLAGLCGSFQRLEAPQGGIAHALYNNFSIIPELRGKLHGEKVAFGLIVQGILENQSLQELESRIAVFNALKLPLTLEELGLTGDVDAKLIKVALLVKQHVPHYNGLYKPYAAEDLVAAIKEASRLTREYRKRQYEPVAKPA
jgi:glycerol dehydrogenase